MQQIHLSVHQLQLMAGAIASLIFVMGTLPMLLKAWRTKDMRSYSLLHLSLMNGGNAAYWLYLCSLPLGPVWLLHAFASVSTLLMLIWGLRYRRAPA
jgi:uncharacterized protein with PQ loop repeat